MTDTIYKTKGQRTREEVIRLFQKGMSVVQIADELGISSSHAEKIIRAYKRSLSAEHTSTSTQGSLEQNNEPIQSETSCQSQAKEPSNEEWFVMSLELNQVKLELEKARIAYQNQALAIMQLQNRLDSLDKANRELANYCEWAKGRINRLQTENDYLRKQSTSKELEMVDRFLIYDEPDTGFPFANS